MGKKKDKMQWVNKWIPPKYEIEDSDYPILGELFAKFVLNKEKGLILNKEKWKGNSKLTELKKEIIKLLGKNGGLIKHKDYNLFNEELEKQNLNDSFDLYSDDYTFNRFVFITKNENIIDSFINHIRNSFAHANFGMYQFKNKKMIWLQNKIPKSRYFNMRGVVEIEILLKIYELMSNGK